MNNYNSNEIESYKLKKDFFYILWLRNRLKKLDFGIKNKVKTDNSLDFEMLKNKHTNYLHEYNLLVDKFYSYLKHGNNLQQKTDYLGEEG